MVATTAGSGSSIKVLNIWEEGKVLTEDYSSHPSAHVHILMPTSSRLFALDASGSISVWDKDRSAKAITTPGCGGASKWGIADRSRYMMRLAKVRDLFKNLVKAQDSLPACPPHCPPLGSPAQITAATCDNGFIFVSDSLCRIIVFDMRSLLPVVLLPSLDDLLFSYLTGSVPKSPIPSTNNAPFSNAANINQQHAIVQTGRKLLESMIPKVAKITHLVRPVSRWSANQGPFRSLGPQGVLFVGAIEELEPGSDRIPQGMVMSVSFGQLHQFAMSQIQQTNFNNQSNDPNKPLLNDSGDSQDDKTPKSTSSKINNPKVNHFVGLITRVARIPRGELSVLKYGPFDNGPLLVSSKASGNHAEDVGGGGVMFLESTSLRFMPSAGSNSANSIRPSAGGEIFFDVNDPKSIGVRGTPMCSSWAAVVEGKHVIKVKNYYKALSTKIGNKSDDTEGGDLLTVYDFYHGCGKQGLSPSIIKKFQLADLDYMDEDDDDIGICTTAVVNLPTARVACVNEKGELRLWNLLSSGASPTPLI